MIPIRRGYMNENTTSNTYINYNFLYNGDQTQIASVHPTTGEINLLQLNNYPEIHINNREYNGDITLQFMSDFANGETLFTVPYDVVDGKGNDDDDSPSKWWIYVVIAVAVVLLLVIGYVIYKKKKGRGEQEGPGGVSM